MKLLHGECGSERRDAGAFRYRLFTSVLTLYATVVCLTDVFVTECNGYGYGHGHGHGNCN